MKTFTRLFGFASLIATLATSNVQASVLNLSDTACDGGSLAVITGTAFSAHCAGDLRIGTFSVIQAEESIHLSAQGHIEVWGQLAAPYISIIAGLTIQLADGSVLITDSHGAPGTLSPCPGGAVITAEPGAPEQCNTVRGISLPPNSREVTPPSIVLVAAIPQPATLPLLAAGSAAMLWLRRLRQQQQRTPDLLA